MIYLLFIYLLIYIFKIPPNIYLILYTNTSYITSIINFSLVYFATYMSTTSKTFMDMLLKVTHNTLFSNNDYSSITFSILLFNIIMC